MSKQPDQRGKKVDHERRQYKRISKNFILSYFDKDHPEKKYELTQLKNISMGGMCFITAQKFDTSTIIGIDLKTPYITDTTYLEGVVLGTNEKMKNLIYETRLKFDPLNPQAKFLLVKLIEYFLNGEKEKHA